MPSSKAKTDQDPKKTLISSKLAKMAMAASEANEEFSLSMLTSELEKQREYLKEDMRTLIKSNTTFHRIISRNCGCVWKMSRNHRNNSWGKL